MLEAVAEGVEWADGAVTLRWLGQWPAVSVWSGGVTAVLAAHGRAGDTTIRWLPTPTPTPTPPTAPSPAPTASSAPAPPAAGKTVRQVPAQGALWIPAAGADGLCVRCGRVWPCLSCGP
ncbi:hypothetical protein EV648_104525 [Kribbella sp. VKM Ac-2568]|nr:hypothetical protein EV648_104525 [Kribbella sp. VKM Ac-2568]